MLRLTMFFLLLGLITLGIHAEDINKDKVFPVTYKGELIPLEAGFSRSNSSIRNVLERMSTILEKKRIPDNSYKILLYPETDYITISAIDEKTRDIVYKTFCSVEKYYFKAVISRTFTLQYANAKEVSELLSNIYCPKMFIPQPDGQIVIKKEKGNIDISPDSLSNSIVVTAPQHVINSIKDTILGLDRRTTQVMIKVLIAEVTLDGSSQFGVEWNVDDASFFGDDDDSTNAEVDFGHQTAAEREELFGFRYAVLDENKVKTLLQTLRSKSKIEVLSSPQLVTSNNSDAYFEETVQVPIVHTTTTATGVINTSIEYEEIGIRLNVTPQINSNEYIKLGIDQTIQNILATPTVQNAPTFSNRAVKTNVIAKNEHTVVIGGLLKDNVTETRRKVPIFGDIPLIKDAFRRNSRDIRKTELMVFITPQIVKTDSTLLKSASLAAAGELKQRLNNASSEYLTISDKDTESKFYVIEVLDDELILNMGAAKTKLDKEYVVVRPESRYLSPTTDKVETIAEKNIASIRITKTMESTSRAEILHVYDESVRIKPGFLVRTPKNYEGFSNFSATRGHLKFDVSELGLQKLSGTITIRNVTSIPIMKTHTQEGTTGEVHMSVLEGEEWKPLKILRLSPKNERFRGILYFRRWIKPDEECTIKIEYSSPSEMVEKFRYTAKQQLADQDKWDDVNFNFGPSSDKCNISVEFIHPVELIYHEMNHMPYSLKNKDGSWSYIWTSTDSPVRITGKSRFRNPQKLLDKINAYSKNGH